MQRYTTKALPAHSKFSDLEGDDWLARVIQHMRDGKKDKSRISRLAFHKEDVEEGKVQPWAAFETEDFKTFMQMYPEAFPGRLRQRSDLFDSIQRARNAVSHPPYLIELTPAKQALATCVTVLEFIKDEGAVDAIKELQDQLNSLDSEGAPDLVEQGAEPRDAQSEDAANLAEQDSGPPARRTGGSFGLTRGRFYLTRERFYVLAPIVLIAIVALLAVAFELRSGNGPPVCSDIADVELTGSGDPNGTVALGGYCTDANDGELMFTAASSDNDIVGAAVSGDSLILTAGDGSGGRAAITVTATDPDGRSATASFVVVVDDDGGEPPRVVSPTIGSASGGATSLPYPSGGYARCGSNTWRVYWFNGTGPSKHWLYLTWREVEHRVPGWGEHMISHLRQAECDLWPDGPDWTASYDPRFD